MRQRHLAFARNRSAAGSHHPFPDATCVLEIDGAGTPAVRQFLEECLCLLDFHGIDFALHWGKTLSYLTLSDQDYSDRCNASIGQHIPRRTIAQCYGADLDRWRSQRAGLLTNKAERLFAPPYLKKIGVLE